MEKGKAISQAWQEALETYGEREDRMRALEKLGGFGPPAFTCPSSRGPRGL